MCCAYSAKATANLKRRFARAGGKLVLWKVYYPQRNHLVSPVMGMFVEGPGLVVSDRSENQVPPTRMPNVSKGIHVYTRKDEAVDEAAESAKDVVVPVHVRLSHLVCAGFDDDAVFTKVRILKKDFDRATKSAANSNRETNHEPKA